MCAQEVKLILKLFILFTVVFMYSYIPKGTTFTSLSICHFESRVEQKSYISQLDLESHGAISIQGNINFSTTAQLEGWSGNGSEDDPFIISGLNITVSNEAAITISNTTVHFEILDCLLEGAIYGLHLQNITHGVFNNLECAGLNPNSIGAFVQASSEISLTNLSCNSNSFGLFLDSVNDIILDNITCNYNTNRGIEIIGSANSALTNVNCSENYLYGISLDTCNNITLEDTQLMSNIGSYSAYGLFIHGGTNYLLSQITCRDNYYGIHLEESSSSIIRDCLCQNNLSGIVLYQSDNNTLVDNEVVENDSGIRLGSSYNNTMIRNLLRENQIGVRLDSSSSSNSIVNNIFDRNTLQARDNGDENAWDDGIGTGNRWSDYYPTQTGSYQIDGTAGNYDNYPRPYDSETPVIFNPPDDLEYVEGSVGNTIRWVPMDNTPHSFIVLQNGTIFRSGRWYGSAITIYVDNLEVGVHNFTLVVNDTSENYVSDTVFVFVLVDSIPPIIDEIGDVMLVDNFANHTLEWNVSELNPSIYEVYRNGTLIDIGNWEDSTFAYVLHAIPVGTYNYTIVLIDIRENWASDSVRVSVVYDQFAPTIISPGNQQLMYMSSFTITWYVSDHNPEAYSIVLNGVEVESGDWDGSSINYTLNQLSLGTHHLTLDVWDKNGNSGYDEVILTVDINWSAVIFIGGSMLGGAILGLLALYGFVSMRRSSMRTRELRAMTKERDRVSLAEYSERVGMSIDDAAIMVETDQSLILSEDGSKIIRLEGLKDYLATTLRREGILDIPFEAAKWKLPPAHIEKITASLLLPAVKTKQGKILYKSHMHKELIRKLEEKGIVELRLYADNLGIGFGALIRDLRGSLKEGHHMVSQGEIITTTQWIADFKDKAEELEILDVMSFADELQISPKSLELMLSMYVAGTFDTYHKTFVVGVDRVERVIKPREVEPKVKVLRGGEFVGNRFRYKVKVVNDSDFVITDVTVILLSYPRDTLALEDEQTDIITKIEPGGFRSPTFDFLPTEDCVRGEIIASVSYVDHFGDAHSTTTEPYIIRAVCDLLRPETISSEDFTLKLLSLEYGEMAIRVEEWTQEEMHSKTLQILQNSNFFEVTTETDIVGEFTESKISGWARGLYTGKPLGIQITITGKPEVRGATCKVRMAGEDEAMIMPAIDEITQKLNAWLCPMCGGGLPTDIVDNLKAGRSASCPFCGVTMDR